MDEIAVLVLNYTFEPLHFTNARRAITLLLAGKAEAVEASPRVVRSPSVTFALPAVIRLAMYIRKPFLDRVAFNKKNILRRDGYTCLRCNLRKGNRLAEEVGMRLIREPVHPKFVFSTHMLRHPHAHSLLDSWRKYLLAVPTPS